MMNNLKKYLAEMLGTLILVIFGCGAAAISGVAGNSGIEITALAFGLAITIMFYTIGNISGCHINPAVTIVMFLKKRLSLYECLGYIASQILGAVEGALVVALFMGSFKSLGANTAQVMLVNSYGQTGSLFVALGVEILLSFVFVFTILSLKDTKNSLKGIIIGFVLTLVHIIGIRLTGTSVNPARSLGPALVEMLGGSFTAIKQIWIFILGPFAGAVVASIVHTILNIDYE